MRRHRAGAAASRSEIAEVVFETACPQRRDHRILVDDPVTGEVEERSAALHDRKALVVDQMPRDVEQRHMQRHKVRLLEQLFDAVGFADA